MRNEWKRFGCTTAHPTFHLVSNEPIHFDEGCLDHEMMTPHAEGPDSIYRRYTLSRLTLSWLHDMGYNVKYENAGDLFFNRQNSCCAAGRRLRSNNTQPVATIAPPTEHRMLDLNSTVIHIDHEEVF